MKHEKVMKLFDHYYQTVYETKYKTIQGEKIILLIPKEMLKRLVIVLAQIKTVNTSRQLLNKIHQVIYFFVYFNTS